MARRFCLAPRRFPLASGSSLAARSFSFASRCSAHTRDQLISPWYPGSDRHRQPGRLERPTRHVEGKPDPRRCAARAQPGQERDDSSGRLRAIGDHAGPHWGHERDGGCWVDHPRGRRSGRDSDVGAAHIWGVGLASLGARWYAVCRRARAARSATSRCTTACSSYRAAAGPASDRSGHKPRSQRPTHAAHAGHRCP